MSDDVLFAGCPPVEQLANDGMLLVFKEMIEELIPVVGIVDYLIEIEQGHDTLGDVILLSDSRDDVF